MDNEEKGAREKAVSIGQSVDSSKFKGEREKGTSVKGARKKGKAVNLIRAESSLQRGFGFSKP